MDHQISFADFCHKRSKTTTSREGHKSNKLPFLGSLLRSCSLQFLKMNPIKLVFGFWNKRVDCAIQTHELTEASVLQAIADAFDSLGEDEMLTAVSHVFTKGYKKVFDREGIKLLVCVHCFSHFLLSHKPFQEKKNSSSLLSIHHNFWANHFNETKVHFILQSSFVVTQISIASFPL